MSEIADRYRRLAQGFTRRVDAVPADRWASQTPCGDWTAADLVGHMGQAADIFLTRVGRTVPTEPSAAADPAGAWYAARDTVQAALDDPEVAATEYDSPMGRMSFAAGIDSFVSFDTLVHAWDLARATGGDERLDPDEVRAAFDQAQQWGDLMRSSGAFGPALDPPPGADQQTRLLCFLGRAV